MANRFLSNVKINDAYTFPASDGTNGQVITTDGAGNLSFQSAGEAGATVIYKDLFTGNASTVVFTLANSVDNEVKTQVYFDGVYQSKENYTVSGNAITFSTAPPSGAAIEVITFATVAAADYNQKLNFYGKAVGTIAKGDAVMFAGAQGDHFLIAKATQAALEANHEYFLGLAAHDFVNNQYGYVTQFGRLEAMDTSDYTAGDILWFDSEGTIAGAITTTEPAAPNTRIQIAAVVRVHQEEGVIFIRPTAHHELGETTDVSITNVADKDLLSWNATLGVWENTKTLGNITTGNITTSGTVDGVDVSSFKSDYDTHNHDSIYYTETEIDTLLTNKSNWDTAYSWGDHSLVGYLTSFTETDPVFSASPSAGITSTQITNWNTAYGWGDHSTQSYATQTYVGNAIAGLIDSAPATLDTLNELAAALGDDPNFATTVSNSIGLKWTQDNVKISNWDTAYSWGDHAGLYSLLGHTHPYLPLTGGTLTGALTTGRVTISNNVSAGGFGSFNDYQILLYQSSTGFTQSYGIGIEADTMMFNSDTRYRFYVDNVVKATIESTGSLTLTGGITASGYNNTNWDTAYGWGNHASAGYLTSVTNVSGYSNQLYSNDLRTISPSSHGAYRATFGFTSWANNNGGPWADYIHLRSYSDASGGSDNLITFLKSGIGMRIWQQSWGSSSAYSSYVDVITSGNISSQSVNYATSAGSAASLTNSNPSFTSVTATTLAATSPADATGLSFRSSVEAISGEGWCTAHYAYNNNDGFLFLNRDVAGTARPVFHIGGYNNAGYAGWSDADSMITLVRSDSVKNTGSTYAGKGLSASSYYSNIVKTTSGTIFRDSQSSHTFTGSVVAGDMRAPIFYDSNDTGYYVDPSSGSVLNVVQANGGIKSNRFEDTGGSFIYRTGSNTGTPRHINLADTTSDPSVALGTGISWGQRTDGSPYYIIRTIQENYNGNYTKLDISWHTGIKIGAASTYGGTRFYNNSTYLGSEIMRVGTANNDVYINYIGEAGSSLRAPIFYDSNNTAYFLNPDTTGVSLKIKGGIVTDAPSGSVLLEHQVSEANAWIFKENATNWGLYWFNAGSESGQGIGSYTTVGAELFGMNNAVTGFNPPETWAGIDTATRAAWMLSNYSGYFWSQGTQYSETDMRAPIFYDTNTAYYVDPASTSNISNLHLDGYIHVSRSNTTGNGIILADDGDIVDLNDGYCAMRFSYGVRVHSANRGGGAVHTLHSNGTFTASGDVVAYSDARVKENIEPITDALEKTLSLKGVYYNRTDKEDKSRKIGVIAQEIIEVLPEVVTEDDQGMLGVSYGNITAVLIEAIKELSKKVEELENKLNGNN